MKATVQDGRIAELDRGLAFFLGMHNPDGAVGRELDRFIWPADREEFMTTYLDFTGSDAKSRSLTTALRPVHGKEALAVSVTMRKQGSAVTLSISKQIADRNADEPGKEPAEENEDAIPTDRPDPEGDAAGEDG